MHCIQSVTQSPKESHTPVSRLAPPSDLRGSSVEAVFSLMGHAYERRHACRVFCGNTDVGASWCKSTVRVSKRGGPGSDTVMC